jgi:hypothetical protein
MLIEQTSNVRNFSQKTWREKTVEGTDPKETGRDSEGLVSTGSRNCNTVDLVFGFKKKTKGFFTTWSAITFSKHRPMYLVLSASEAIAVIIL